MGVADWSHPTEADRSALVVKALLSLSRREASEIVEWVTKAPDLAGAILAALVEHPDRVAQAVKVMTSEQDPADDPA